MKKLLVIALILPLITMFLAWSNPKSASTLAPFDDEKYVLIAFHEGYSYEDLSVEISVDKSFNLINAIKTKMYFEEVKAIQDDPIIDYIEIEEPTEVSFGPPFSNPSTNSSWGLKRIFQSEDYPYDVWDTAMGDGVKVAVFDTGIDGTHEHLNVVGGVNVINDTPYDEDNNGHGTHVAGIIAGLNEDLITGVAPNVELYSVKVFNDEGNGTTLDLVDGIQWAVDNDIPLINMSLGTSAYSQSLKNAINQAHDLGHIFVAASGNNGEEENFPGISYPARFENVIAVGAMNQNDEIAAFTSYGPELDIVAPGVNILSSLPENEYGYKSGTSMAAPFVSGIIALMLHINPDLTPQEIKGLLTDFSEDLGYDSDLQGHGLLRGDWVVNATYEGNHTTTFTLDFIAYDHGVISPEGTYEVPLGSDWTFDLSPDEGYRVSDILINSESIGAKDTFTLFDIDQDYVIEAFFEKAYFTINFETFDSEDFSSIEVQYNDDIPDLASPPLKGHTFKGWYMDESFEETFDLETMPAQDLTLYARFERNSYTIDFETFEGEAIASKQVTFEDDIPSLEEPPLKGHTFKGWYMDESFEEAFDLETMPAQDLTLFARFERNSYTLDFETFEGEAIASKQVTFEDDIPSLEEPPLKGHTFKGWYTDETFEEIFDLEAMPAYDIKLYAKYEVNQYYLSIYLEDRLVYNEKVAYETELESLDLPQPTKEGFSFKSFTPSKNTMPADDLRLDVNLERNAYTITFNLDDSEVVEQLYMFEETIDYPDPPFKQGYDFVGWQTQDEIVEKETMPAYDLNLQPIYEERDPPKIAILEAQKRFDFDTSILISSKEDVAITINDEPIEDDVVLSYPGDYTVVLEDGHYKVIYTFSIEVRPYSQVFDMGVFLSAVSVIGVASLTMVRRFTL